MKRQILPGTMPAPRGVTLTEVLMSLMIMSIGVGLVATLFPIAALRSAQATKMTNAAITKLNVESMLDARPQLIFDPDGDFEFSTSVAPARWNRLTEHFRSNAEKNYIVDPSGYFAMVAAGNSPASVSVTSGLIDAAPAAGLN
ncbi:MAG: prepilin-type N-terminal cleavage/methylation domain-containing protein [Planctomycetaceae bacterium]|nr:prepilin-type N-terminal cleavage/methylation domain-containing protein [Planctomycetaceae bacterium]